MQFGCLARCCAAALTVLTVGCIKYCSSVSHMAQMESAVWTLMTGSILKEVCPPSLQILHFAKPLTQPDWPLWWAGSCLTSSV